MAVSSNEAYVTKDQDLKKLSDGRYRLKAKLADTSQVRWWLLGFGGQIEVVKPKSQR